jgi:GT2 family glycosyltransferase
MSATKTIAMGIPTINRADLLDIALQVYCNTWRGHHIYIVDNGKQRLRSKLRSHHIINSPYNLGVAKSWNLICKRALSSGYTHAAILNDDVVWNRSATEVEQYINDNPADIYVGIDTNMSCFVISLDMWNNEKLLDKVRGFDETFYPAYFEDMDYLYRLKLCGKTVHYSKFFSPEMYLQSQSIAREPELKKDFDKNREYYVKKWGGVPTMETFRIPFNKPIK